MVGTQELPAIVRYGQQFIGSYPPCIFRRSLFRAFRQCRGDCIVLDNNLRNQRLRAACVAWGVREGLLSYDLGRNGGQETISSFRLTTKGQKEIFSQ